MCAYFLDHITPNRLMITSPRDDLTTNNKASYNQSHLLICLSHSYSVLRFLHYQFVKEHCTHQSTKHVSLLPDRLEEARSLRRLEGPKYVFCRLTLPPPDRPEEARSLRRLEGCAVSKGAPSKGAPSNNLSFLGASRDRTDDPLLAKQMLSQLSYGPKYLSLLFLRLPTYPLGLSRLELPTPRLSSVCSNQLSYRP